MSATAAVLFAVLELAADAIPIAIRTYRALRDAILSEDPRAQASIDLLDEMVAKALTDLPAIHAAQAADLLK